MRVRLLYTFWYDIYYNNMPLYAFVLHSASFCVIYGPFCSSMCTFASSNCLFAFLSSPIPLAYFISKCFSLCVSCFSYSLLLLLSFSPRIPSSSFSIFFSLINNTLYFFTNLNQESPKSYYTTDKVEQKEDQQTCDGSLETPVRFYKQKVRIFNKNTCTWPYKYFKK